MLIIFIILIASLTGQKDQTISRFENINENSSFADKVQAFIFKFFFICD